MRPRFKVNCFIAVLGLAVVLAACAGQPVPRISAGAQNVTSLAFDPLDGSLLKTDAAGLNRLAADSHAWQPVHTPVTSSLTGVVLNPDDPATMYVSGIGAGVLKSTDGGQSWSQVISGLTTTDVAALAIHSFRRATLYVWLDAVGMYRTEDGGAHWNRMPDQGPPDTQVRSLVHSTLPGSMNTGWLYAATPSGAYLTMDCF